MTHLGFGLSLVLGVLARGGAVDTNGGGEGKEDVVVGECLLVFGYGVVEGQKGALPCGSKGHEQDHFVVFLTRLDGVVYRLLVALHVRDGFFTLVAGV